MNLASAQIAKKLGAGLWGFSRSAIGFYLRLWEVYLWVFSVVALFAVVSELKKPEPGYLGVFLILGFAGAVFASGWFRRFVLAYVVALVLWMAGLALIVLAVRGPDYRVTSETGVAWVKVVLFSAPLAPAFFLMRRFWRKTSREGASATDGGAS